MQAALAAFPPLFDDLSHRRAEAINETSAMRRFFHYVCTVPDILTVPFHICIVESHSAERHQSRRRLIKHAKARIDEEQENQRVCSFPLQWSMADAHTSGIQIATDASTLIKHYKALLLS